MILEKQYGFLTRSINDNSVTESFTIRVELSCSRLVLVLCWTKEQLDWASRRVKRPHGPDDETYWLKTNQHY